MAFINAQKLKYDDDGNITSGSAAICESVYVSEGRYHSRKETREKLGKVIWLAEDKKTGIFLSPTRGLVLYDANKDEFFEVDNNDERIQHRNLFPEPSIHTMFGDAYLLLEFLNNSGILAVLRRTFPKDELYERVLCHILHSVLKQGGRIDCESFMERSFCSTLFKDVVNSSLVSDTRYFEVMGRDDVKVAFFRNYIDFMKKVNPEFGRCCLVDSTPLPNDSENNPFNAFCTHGKSGGAVMSRLILILDEATGMPVWYKFIEGNINDTTTLRTVEKDVETTLGIKIESFVLDAGYITKELIHQIHIGSGQHLLAKAPNREGYHFKSLYHTVAGAIRQAKNDFVRKDHTYFGKQVLDLFFGEREYAYVYVDRENALTGYKNYQIEHPDEFEQLSDAEKNWKSIESGFFVIISNENKSPKEILDDYFERVDIESFFKTTKEYLDLLPLAKWTPTRVFGKILSDMISTIIFRNIQAELKGKGWSVDKMFSKSSSLMGTLDANGYYTVEYPKPQIREAYKLMGVKVPRGLDLKKYSQKIMSLKV